MPHLSITKIIFHSFKSFQSILKHKLDPFKKGLSKARMAKRDFHLYPFIYIF